MSNLGGDKSGAELRRLAGGESEILSFSCRWMTGWKADRSAARRQQRKRLIRKGFCRGALQRLTKGISRARNSSAWREPKDHPCSLEGKSE